MKKLLELISNSDGTLSRTQVSLWIMALTCLVYMALHVIWGVLDTPLLVLMVIYIVSGHIDRMDARRFDLKASRSGVEVSLHGAQEEGKDHER